MPPEIERIYTWNRDDVVEIIANAVGCIHSAGIPEDLRVSAFEKAVQMLSHHNAVAKQSPLAIDSRLLHG